MVTVKVVWEDTGQPAEGQRVAIGFDGLLRGVAGDEYTNSMGEAHFDNDPGSGEVYIDGSTRYRGMIQGRIVVYI